MNARFFALVVAAAGLAGCATDPSATPPGPRYEREISEGRPGFFGDLRWNIDLSGKREPSRVSEASAQEQDDFKKWRESMGPSERQEFEEWRAWQEWKRKNPK
ncbi:MAG TPA: hypothetical protein VGX52_07325 [Burkholderiales bacterium]|nr:hypothetical protein [Burkholderiales bacterium]